MNVSDLFPLME